jgi:hypothetical protein
MTELAWLANLLVRHKLPKTVKEAVALRIEELSQSPQRPSVLPAHMQGQAPSTIARMMSDAPPPPLTPLPPAAPSVDASARIVGGEIQTGAGIRGPRKY